MPTSIALTKHGAMIKVVVAGDGVEANSTRVIHSSIARPEIKPVGNVDTGAVNVVIGGSTYTLQDITGFTIEGSQATDMADFLTKISAVFPEEGSGSYKRYVALLSIPSGDDPTLEVLENSFGEIAWERASEGRYSASLIGGFGADNIFVNGFSTGSSSVIGFPIISASTNEILGYVYIQSVGADNMSLRTVNASFVESDIAITNFSIEIRKYN